MLAQSYNLTEMKVYLRNKIALLKKNIAGIDDYYAYQINENTPIDQIDSQCVSAQSWESATKGRPVEKLLQLRNINAVELDHKANTPLNMTQLIPTPLSWNELKIILPMLSLETELQHELRVILLAFIHQCINNNSKNDEEERRHIEYLINAMSMAKKQEGDENNLFSKSTATSGNIGIDFIIACTQNQNNVSNKFLLPKLTHLLKKVHAGHVIYSQPAKPVNKADEDITQLTPSQAYRLYWKYFSRFTKNSKIKLDDEVLTDLHKALYYLTNAAGRGHAVAFSKLKTVSEPFLMHEAQARFNVEKLFYLTNLKTLLPDATLLDKSIDAIFKSEIEKSYEYQEITSIPLVNDFHNIKIDANNLMQLLASHKNTVIAYVDPLTKTEIARFRLDDNKITFTGHGNNIKLNISGELTTDYFVDENKNGITLLSANFKSDSLYLASNAKKLYLNSQTKTNKAVLIETSGDFCLTAKSRVNAQQISVKSDSFQCYSNLTANTTVNLNVKKRFSQHPESIITADKAVILDAHTVTKIAGKINSAGVIALKATDAIQLTGASNLSAGELRINANKLLTNRSATLQSNGIAHIAIKDKVVIDEESKWSASQLILNANTIDNGSPNLMFDSGTINFQDKLVNRAAGIIKTTATLNLHGENIFNRGTIDYGKKLDAKINKMFVNGLDNPGELFSQKYSFTDMFNRAKIIGENANITTSVYLNVASLLKTHTLALVSIADIDLGATLHTNKNRPHLFGFSLGAEIPNIPAILSEMDKLLNNIATGNFYQAYKQLSEASVFTKSASLLRAIFSCNLVDFAWNLSLLAAQLPQIKNQINTLNARPNKPENNELVALLNSMSNLATQASYIENEAVNLNSFAAHLSAPSQLDLMALALPYSTTSSIIEVEGGLHADFTSLHRAFISENIFAADIALSQTNVATYADRQHDVNVAFRNAALGASLSRSGTTLAHQDYTNVQDEINSGLNLSDQINSQSQHVTYTAASKTHADTMTLTSRDIELQGQTEVATLNTQSTHHTEIGGHTQSSHLAANSKENIIFSGKNKTNDMRAFAKNIITTGTITAEAAHLASQRLSMEGQISGTQLETIAEVEDNTGTVEETNFSAQADDYQNSGNVSAAQENVHANNITSSGIDESKSAFFAAANNMSAAADFHNKDATVTLTAKHNLDIKGSNHSKTLIATAEQGWMQNANVDNLAINFNHVADVDDLLLGIGIYPDVHAHNALMVTTSDVVTFTKARDLAYSFSLTATAINLFKDIHSSGDLAFTSTQGDIRTSHNTLFGEHSLSIHSNASYINDEGLSFAPEISLQANLDVINNGTIAASNFLSIDAGRDIENNCVVYDIQGRYDHMKVYQPGRFVGGAGIDHNGVGLAAHAGRDINTNGSYWMSTGSNHVSAGHDITSVDMVNRYKSYENDYHNRFGHHSHTVEYAYQQQRSLFYSQHGSNNFNSANGKFYSRSTQFYGESGTNINSKHNDELYGSVLKKECIKSSSNLYGLNHHRSDQMDEYDVPTEVVGLGDDTITSEEGDVDLNNALVQTPGKVTLLGVHVNVSQPVLNHTLTEYFSGLTADSPLMNILQAPPLLQDIHALQNSHGAEWSVNTWNALLDSTIFINNMARGAIFAAILPGANLTPLEIGYTQSRTALKWQTTPTNTGMYVGRLLVVGTKSVTFDNGVTVQVQNDATVQTPEFNQLAARLQSSEETSSAHMAAGMDLALKPSFSAAAAHSSQQQTSYENQHFTAKTMNVDATIVNMRGAKDTAETANMNINQLNMASVASSSSSETVSESISSNHNVSANRSNSASSNIDEVTGIQAQQANLNINVLTMNASSIHASQGGQAHINTINSNSMQDTKTGNATGISGNSQMVSPSLGNKDYQATQDSTISGLDVSSAQVNGPLNQTSGNGLHVTTDTSFNGELKIPTSTDEFSKLKDNFNSLTEHTEKVPTPASKPIPISVAGDPHKTESKTDFGNWAEQKSSYYAHAFFSLKRETSQTAAPPVNAAMPYIRTEEDARNQLKLNILTTFGIPDTNTPTVPMELDIDDKLREHILNYAELQDTLNSGMEEIEAFRGNPIAARLFKYIPPIYYTGMALQAVSDIKKGQVEELPKLTFDVALFYGTGCMGFPESLLFGGGYYLITHPDALKESAEDKKNRIDAYMSAGHLNHTAAENLNRSEDVRYAGMSLGL